MCIRQLGDCQLAVGSSQQYCAMSGYLCTKHLRLHKAARDGQLQIKKCCGYSHPGYCCEGISAAIILVYSLLACHSEYLISSRPVATALKGGYSFVDRGGMHERQPPFIIQQLLQTTCTSQYHTLAPVVCTLSCTYVQLSFLYYYSTSACINILHAPYIYYVMHAWSMSVLAYCMYCRLGLLSAWAYKSEL